MYCWTPCQRYWMVVCSPSHRTTSQATYAAMLKKEDGELDFSHPAQALANKVRAFSPWPGAFTTWQDQPLKIHQARVKLSTSLPHSAGQRAILDGYPAIATPDGYLVFENLQPAGKKVMDGKAFLAGARNWTA